MQVTARSVDNFISSDMPSDISHQALSAQTIYLQRTDINYLWCNLLVVLIYQLNADDLL